MRSRPYLGTDLVGYNKGRQLANLRTAHFKRVVAKRIQELKEVEGAFGHPEPFYMRSVLRSCHAKKRPVAFDAGDEECVGTVPDLGYDVYRATFDAMPDAYLRDQTRGTGCPLALDVEAALVPESYVVAITDAVAARIKKNRGDKASVQGLPTLAAAAKEKEEEA
jgi:hypothetical protein